jgi:hypothetical protein
MTPVAPMLDPVFVAGFRAGTITQAQLDAMRDILMSVCQTLKKREADPLQPIVDALWGYAATCTLPPLPEKVGSSRWRVTHRLAAW